LCAFLAENKILPKGGTYLLTAMALVESWNDKRERKMLESLLPSLAF